MFPTNSLPTFVKKIGCAKVMADFLVFTKHLPLLSHDGGVYYFTDNAVTTAAMADAPAHVRIANMREMKIREIKA